VGYPFEKTVCVVHQLTSILRTKYGVYALIRHRTSVMGSRQHSRPFSLDLTCLYKELAKQTAYGSMALCRDILGEQGGFGGMHRGVIRTGNRICRQAAGLQESGSL
jgi:hypothetical protein